jgi:diguanylate cyclase (GGDEF)-like protein/PAS domain S-box-containing protein
MERSHPVGFVTMPDILSWIAAGLELKMLRVGDVMAPLPAIALADLQTDGHLSSRFRAAQTHHLVVLDAEQIVGVVVCSWLPAVEQIAIELQSTPIQSVMQHRVLSVEPFIPMREVAQRMESYQCFVSLVSSVAAVDFPWLLEYKGSREQGDRSFSHTVGLVTAFDLLQYQELGFDLSQVPVHQGMSYPVFQISAEDSAWDAYQIMEQHQLFQLVVHSPDSQDCIGLVSWDSIQTAIAPVETTEQATTEQALHVSFSLPNPIEGVLLQHESRRCDMQAPPISAPQETQHPSIFCPPVIASARSVLPAYGKPVEPTDPDPTLVGRLRPDGTLTTINASFAAFLGRSPQQLIGSNLFELVSPDLATQFHMLLKTLTPTRSIGMMEYHRQKSDQSWQWLQWHGFACFSPTQHITEIQLIGLDISDCKRIEQVLKESETRYRTLAESIQDIFFAFDPHMRFTYWNVASEQQFGWSAEDVLGKSFTDLFPHLEGSAVDVFYWTALQTQRPNQIFWMHRIHEQDFVFEVRAYPFDGGLAVFVTDTTEQQHHQLALQDSEAQIRLLTDSLPSMMAYIDTEERYRLVNRQYAAWFGQSKESIIGATVKTVVGESLYQEIQDNLQLALQGKRVSFEMPMVALSGQVNHKQVDYVPCFDSSQAVLGVHVLITDISARKHIEEELRLQIQRERLVGEIAQHISQSLELETILTTTVNEVRSLLQADRVIVHRFESDWRGLVIEESVNSNQLSMLGWFIRDPWAIAPPYLNLYRQGRVLSIEDIYTQPLDKEQQSFLEFFRIRAELLVPLSYNNNLWGLLITQQCDRPRQWKPGEVRLLRQLATQASIAIHQAELYHQLEQANQRLQRLAFLDGLTQVANRRRFDQHLEREWRRLSREHAPLSLLLCDIDFFKAYNDTYGHQAGDDCLRQIAAAIAASVNRPADLVARYGGEEFAVVLPNTGFQGAQHVAEDIRRNIQDLEILHSGSLVSSIITLSIGVATALPNHTLFPEDIVHLADEALYAAKQSGRNTYRCYFLEESRRVNDALDPLDSDP